MRNLTMAIFILVAGFLMGIGFSSLIKEDKTVALHQAMASSQDQLSALDTKVSALTRKIEAIVPVSSFVQPEAMPQATAETMEPGNDYSYNTPDSQPASNIDQYNASQEQLNSLDTQEEAVAELTTNDNFIKAELLFQQEPYDQQWSLVQQENIYALFNNSDKFTGLSINEVICRSHSCRLQLNINETNAEKNLESVIIGELGQQFPNATWKREDNYMTLLVSTAQKSP